MILFSNSSPKKPKQRIFGLKFKDFCFRTKLCNKINSRALILNTTLVFQNCCPKHLNKAFLVLNLRILIFAQNFAIRQIRGHWFQIWQQLFKIPAQKYTNKVLLVPNLRIFNFARNFVFWKIRDCLKYNNSFFFKCQPKNTQIRQFWF